MHIGWFHFRTDVGFVGGHRVDERLKSPVSVKASGGSLTRVVLALALPAMAGSNAVPAAHCQILHASGSRPSFEVATIKPSKPDETVSGMRFSDGGRVFLTSNATLRDLIQEGYNVKATSQIAGATGWMTTEKFDLAARLEDADAARLASLPMDEKIQQIRLMVQSLLADRFRLKLESSTRQSSFFTLLEAKGGAKLRPSVMAAADPNGINVPHPVAGPSLVRKGAGKLEAAGVSMPLLADTLSRMPELGGEGGFTIGDLVVDKTGLTGSYDWSLSWTPVNREGGDPAPETAGPSLFTAVREQLGLRLERTKGTVEVLVIEHVERPTAN